MKENFYRHEDYKYVLEQFEINSVEDLEKLTKIGEVISIGNRGAVILSKFSVNNQYSVYLKKYNYKKPNFRYLGRLSRAHRENFSYKAFSSMGISHPDVLFCGDKRVGGKLHWAIIATKEIEKSTDLVKLFLHERDNHILRHQIMELLGTKTGVMHKYKFLHGTFRFRNLLCQPENIGAGIFFIDCPGGSYNKFSIGRNSIFDLICIYKDIRAMCTDEEWETFLKAYTKVTHTKINKWRIAVPKICEKKFGPAPQINWNDLAKSDGLFR